MGELSMDCWVCILGFCEVGSDYKSWTVVNKLWNNILRRLFPDPQLQFGNKFEILIQRIPEVQLLEKYKSILSQNPYNTLQFLRKYNIKQRLSGGPFDRKFETQEEALGVAVGLSETALYSFYKIHPSISIKTVLKFPTCALDSDYWVYIPCTHKNITDEEWVELKKRDVCGPSVEDYIQAYHAARFGWWCWPQYLTTTPGMIEDACKLLNLSDITKMIMLSKCPNLDIQQVLYNPNRGWDWYLITYNTFGYHT